MCFRYSTKGNLSEWYKKYELARITYTFVDFILEDDNIKSISLTVFDFNQKAKRIYEKLGFEINEVIETPRLKYIMKRYR